MASSTKTRHLLNLVVVLAILAASLWFALRGVEWGELWGNIARINLLWILVSVAVTISSHFIRAERWRILIPEGNTVGRFNAFSATVIGYMMNNIIPRSGEVIRPWVLARREQRPFSRLLATVLVERILDGLALLLIFLLLLVVSRQQLENLLPGYTATGILLTLSIPILGLIILVALAVKTTLGTTMVAWLCRRFPGKLTAKLQEIFQEFRSGVNFSGARGGTMILLWSLLLWVFYAFSIYFGFLAFGYDQRYGLGMGAMVTTLAITTVGITIAPTPGAFGVYHLFCRTALVTLYAVGESDAVSFALVMHAAPYLGTILIGALLMLREGISFGEATQHTSRDTANG
ncbi:MAG: flippase-like domain-containing protein [Candidatus Kapabacteria bacterium]|nr:flippase-like domain-containing protein [Candidatus Kapabacteria bacterium]